MAWSYRGQCFAAQGSVSPDTTGSGASGFLSALAPSGQQRRVLSGVAAMAHLTVIFAGLPRTLYPTVFESI